MIDTAAFLIGSYGAMAAGLSVTIAKVSPTIGPRMRHLFSGAAPLAAVLATRLGGADSIVLEGMDLFAAGGLVAVGVVTSSAVGKIVPTAEAKDCKLLPR
jgi:hypothetical protein